MRSSSSRVAFQTCACEWSVPGEDAQVGQPADERVGGRLEDAHEQRAVLVRRDLDRGAGLVGRPRGAPRRPGRGGSAMNASSSAWSPMPLARRPDQHGGEDALLDALAQARLELRVGDLLALEVLHQDVVVRLGRGLEQLVAPPGDLAGQLVGDRDLDLLRAVPAVGLAMDEVDVAAERLGGADGELERRDLVAERRRAARRGRAVGSAFSRSHLLMKKHAARPVDRPSATACSRPGLDAGRGVHDEERAIGRGEALDHVGDEVRVAGRVDERDPRPVVLERPDREAQRLAPLLLLGLEVEVGRPVVDLAQARDRPGPEAAAARRASSCRRRRGRPGRRCGGGGGRRSSSSSASTVLLRVPTGLGGRRQAREASGSGHHSRLYSRPRCQVIPSGRRSSARRASTTPSAARSSPRSRARSASPRARAAATPTPTTGCGWRSRRRARSTCRRQHQAHDRQGDRRRRGGAVRGDRLRGLRPGRRGGPRRGRRPTTATAPRPRSARCSRSPAGSSRASGAVAWQFEPRGLITVAARRQ